MRKFLVIAVILAISGCASLPMEVNVQTGPELAAPAAQELSFYTPSGPTPGAGAQEIISGFLSAGTGPQNEYAVAREFLTTDFAPRWNPDGGVLIRSGVPTFKSTGGSLQVVDVTISASVDSQGIYLDFDDPKPNSLRFQLLKEDGEWRISNAPNLTVVAAPVFAVVFKAHSLYFLDTTKNRLISDLRWFPTKASTGTKLVNALLEGPSPWLIEGVTTAIPEGTHMTIDAVRIEDGIAQVDLDANALRADALDRRLMLSQLRNTLLQISGVRDVEVSINNSAQDIAQAPIYVSPNGGSAYSLSGDGVARIAAGAGASIIGTAAMVKQENPYLFALDNSGNRVAMAAEKGIFLLEANGVSARSTKLGTQTGIASLLFDVTGRLWVFPKSAAEPIVIFDENGTQRFLSDGLEGERIAASLGNEGAKLALAVKVGNRSKIELFTVGRNQSSIPTSLNPASIVLPVVGEPISLIWHDSNSIRVLERTSSNLTALSEYPIHGPRKQLTMPPVIGVKLAVGPAALSTYLLSEDGGVWALSGSTWRRTTVDSLDISSLR